MFQKKSQNAPLDYWSPLSDPKGPPPPSTDPLTPPSRLRKFLKKIWCFAPKPTRPLALDPSSARGGSQTPGRSSEIKRTWLVMCLQNQCLVGKEETFTMMQSLHKMNLFSNYKNFQQNFSRIPLLPLQLDFTCAGKFKAKIVFINNISLIF